MRRDPEEPGSEPRTVHERGTQTGDESGVQRGQFRDTQDQRGGTQRVKGRGLRRIRAESRAKGSETGRGGGGQKGTEAGRGGDGRGPSGAAQPRRAGAGPRETWAGPGLTLLAGGRRCAPGQVPLAGQNVGAEQLIARLALVSKHRAPDQIPVGGRPPAPLRRWQLWARVVPRNLCRGETASLEAVGRPTQGSLPASGTTLLPGSLACRTPAQFRTLDLGTFEMQHETLPQARVRGPWRCLEL